MEYQCLETNQLKIFLKLNFYRNKETNLKSVHK